MIKVLYALLVWSLLQIADYFFSLSNFQLLSLACIALTAIWFFYDKTRKDTLQNDYHDLLLEVQSTSNDAHLMYKQMATILSNIPFPILLLDEQGIVVMHNRCDDIIDSNLKATQNNLTYLDNNYYTNVQDFIKDAFILERDVEKVMIINRQEFMGIGVPITANGLFKGVFFLFQNISKTLEGEKKQRQFLADASHELKTPIAVIKGMLEILNRSDFNDQSVQADFLKQMQQECLRLDILVKDLLQLSKIDSTNIVLDRDKYDFANIVQKICQSLDAKIKQKKLKFNLSNLQKQDIFCDEMRFTQAISNLIQNAVNYSDHGEITICNYQDGFDFVFEVRDEGCGIAPEQISKIFDRFYRVHEDRARTSGGSGLGLSIAKQVVEAHGGTIEVESEVNKGSCFTVRMKN